MTTRQVPGGGSQGSREHQQNRLSDRFLAVTAPGPYLRPTESGSCGATIRPEKTPARVTTESSFSMTGGWFPKPYRVIGEILRSRRA